jgi:hypothetical protein
MGLDNQMTPAQIVAELPDLEPKDIRQALAYAAALARDELHSTVREGCGSLPMPVCHLRSSTS